MSASGDAYAAIVDALDGIDGLRVYRFEQAAAVIPGGQGKTAAIVGPADPLEYRTYGNAPTNATFRVMVIAAWGTAIIETLLEAVEATVMAVHTAVAGSTVTSVVYGIYASADSELPMYELVFLVPLQP